MTTERDIRNQIAFARDKGREEGEAKGRAEGEAIGETNAALRIAKAMLARGTSINDIAEITGLSDAEVEALAS